VGSSSGIRWCARRSTEVITLSGDGGLAMLLGELITLRQQKLPVKIVLFNNGRCPSWSWK
jgi:thiamine pyrophosphate-dependent acetolactate synthase large subunit-like protein